MRCKTVRVVTDTWCRAENLAKFPHVGFHFLGVALDDSIIEPTGRLCAAVGAKVGDFHQHGGSLPSLVWSMARGRRVDPEDERNQIASAKGSPRRRVPIWVPGGYRTTCCSPVKRRGPLRRALCPRPCGGAIKAESAKLKGLGLKLKAEIQMAEISPARLPPHRRAGLETAQGFASIRPDGGTNETKRALLKAAGLSTSVAQRCEVVAAIPAGEFYAFDMRRCAAIWPPDKPMPDGGAAPGDRFRSTFMYPESEKGGRGREYRRRNRHLSRGLPPPPC